MFKEGQFIRHKSEEYNYLGTGIDVGVVWGLYSDDGANATACDATFLADDGVSYDAIYTDEEVEVIEFDPLNERHCLIWSKSSWHGITGENPKL